ncbi:MAG: hypothetical protein OEV73_07990 [Desulfobulbaceae bacterium]|nr:hypothetical protein [Desulfobulbaceae bacterium]
MRMRIAMLLLLLPLVAASGCAKTVRPTVQPLKGAPVVYIHPMTDTYRQAKLGVLPFQVPAGMGEAQAHGVAGLFKDVLLGKRTFPVVKQLTTPTGDSAQAVEFGRANDCDLVLLGSLDYAMSGGDLGGARVGVSVRLLSVKTGNTVWYLSQGMDQPMDYPDTGMVNRFVDALSMPAYRGSNGAPTVANMLARIAVDMAEVFAGARDVASR